MTDKTPVTQGPSPEAQASQQIFQIATGYIASTALYVAARLGIADRLADGARPVDDIAAEAGAKPDVLYRVLRALAAVGVFDEVSPRVFANNMASSTMRQGVPGSTHAMALWMPDPFHLRVYADVMHSVTTGLPAAEKTVGMPVFEYLSKDRELSEIFNNAMTAFSAHVVPAILEAYDFSGIRTLVDIAGGHGEMLMSIVGRYPSMQGVLFDVDHVIAGAVPRIRAAGFESRVRTETGDFFKAVPAGGDAYLMKHIIHDWDDDRAAAILENIRRAMNPGARVILAESVLPAGNAPDLGKLMDLEMLLLPGGRERTEAEFSALFERAGFRLTRVVATQAPLSVIEAVGA